MSVLKVFRNILALLAILLLNSVSFGGHSSAMSVMPHEMSGSSHRTDMSAICVTLCRTAIIERERTNIKQEDDENDDKTTVPFYAQNQPWLLANDLVAHSLYATFVKPPPKVPIYIQYQVFRA